MPPKGWTPSNPEVAAQASGPDARAYAAREMHLHLDGHFLPTDEQARGYRRRIEYLAPPVLKDREKEIAEFRLWLEGDLADQWWWWRGAPWSGKTALMASLALNHFPAVGKAFFFVLGRERTSNNQEQALARLIPQLALLAGVERVELPSDPALRVDLFTELIHDATETLAARGRRLLILVDGLDEDAALRDSFTPTASIAGSIPSQLPEGCKFAVASRINPPLPADVEPNHPLFSRQRRLLEAVPSARTAMRHATQELHEVFESRLGADVAALIAAAGAPLRVTDLADLTVVASSGAREIQELFDSRQGRSFLYQEGAEATELTGYQLGHDKLDELLISLIDPSVPTLEERDYREWNGIRRTALQPWRDRIAEWGDRWADKRFPPETPPYLLDPSYVALLVDRNDQLALRLRLTDPARIDLLRRISHSDYAAIQQIRTGAEFLARRDRRLGPISIDGLLGATDLSLRARELILRNTSVPALLPTYLLGLGDAIGAIQACDTLPTSQLRWDAAKWMVEGRETKASNVQEKLARHLQRRFRDLPPDTRANEEAHYLRLLEDLHRPQLSGATSEMPPKSMIPHQGSEPPPLSTVRALASSLPDAEWWQGDPPSQLSHLESALGAGVGSSTWSTVARLTTAQQFADGPHLARALRGDSPNAMGYKDFDVGILIAHLYLNAGMVDDCKIVLRALWAMINSSGYAIERTLDAIFKVKPLLESAGARDLSTDADHALVILAGASAQVLPDQGTVIERGGVTPYSLFGKFYAHTEDRRRAEQVRHAAEVSKWARAERAARLATRIAQGGDLLGAATVLESSGNAKEIEAPQLAADASVRLAIAWSALGKPQNAEANITHALDVAARASGRSPEFRIDQRFWPSQPALATGRSSDTWSDQSRLAVAHAELTTTELGDQLANLPRTARSLQDWALETLAGQHCRRGRFDLAQVVIERISQSSTRHRAFGDLVLNLAPQSAQDAFQLAVGYKDAALLKATRGAIAKAASRQLRFALVNELLDLYGTTEQSEHLPVRDGIIRHFAEIGETGWALEIWESSPRSATPLARPSPPEAVPPRHTAVRLASQGKLGTCVERLEQIGSWEPLSECLAAASANGFSTDPLVRWGLDHLGRQQDSDCRIADALGLLEHYAVRNKSNHTSLGLAQVMSWVEAIPTSAVDPDLLVRMGWLCDDSGLARAFVALSWSSDTQKFEGWGLLQAHAPEVTAQLWARYLETFD